MPSVRHSQSGSPRRALGCASQVGGRGPSALAARCCFPRRILAGSWDREQSQTGAQESDNASSLSVLQTDLFERHSYRDRERQVPPAGSLPRGPPPRPGLALHHGRGPVRVREACDLTHCTPTASPSSSVVTKHLPRLTLRSLFTVKSLRLLYENQR